MSERGHEVLTLEHARALINNLQRRADKSHQEALVAKARIYDFIYTASEVPVDADLKARVITLEDELKKVILQRDKLKFQLGSRNAKSSVSSEQDITL